ncbi:21512_t:CDS:2 [Racocetra persica]|uniref:21512_t:CDS:1 n=1 Tax=Racocetra persica TaxID=160502 RepID=A0ACA9K7W5_9GLOM|nr:21512_t:CDS:2 [Racocetra persica]
MSCLQFLQLQQTNIEKLLNDLISSYNNKKFPDTKIIVGEKGKIETIYANSFILKIRSEYFLSAFSEGWSRKVDKYFVIKKPNATLDSMNIIIRFLYNVDFNASHDMRTLLNIFLLADKMGIMVLHDELKSYFIENIITIMKNNPLLILEFVKIFILYDDLNELLLKALCLNPALLFNFDNKEISESILYELISRSELCLEENLLLSRIIQCCWIQIGFQISLKSETFHKNCDGKGPTIVIIKLLDGDLIGGYNLLDWEVNIKPRSEEMAISCRSEYGPTFGSTDLYIQNGLDFCMVINSHYESLNVSGRFQIVSYEILRVIKQR